MYSDVITVRVSFGALFRPVTSFGCAPFRLLRFSPIQRAVLVAPRPLLHRPPRFIARRGSSPAAVHRPFFNPPSAISLVRARRSTSTQRQTPLRTRAQRTVRQVPARREIYTVPYDSRRRHRQHQRRTDHGARGGFVCVCDGCVSGAAAFSLSRGRLFDPVVSAAGRAIFTDHVLRRLYPVQAAPARPRVAGSALGHAQAQQGRD